MAITFDKKEFKRRFKSLKLGKHKYSFYFSFYPALFFALTMSVVNYFLFDEKIITTLILKFWIYFIVMFITSYFLSKSQWKQIKNDYNESLDYWEKHDQSFFDGEKYEKID